MTEQQEGIAEQRDEIAARVAKYKATQEKFEREREEYFVTTLENARHPRERRSVWS
jgi:chorismate mutase